MSDATRKAKAGHKKNRVTVDQIVAAEFEPWVHGGPDEWTPPSNTQWAEQAPYLLPYVRMAWMSMYKPKGELETIVRELDETFQGDGRRDRQRAEVLRGFRHDPIECGT